MSERFNPQARADKYGRRTNRTHSPARAASVPYASIMLGSILPNLFVAAAAPLIPPLGFLMLIGWRIARPGFFPPWAGALLGAFDDLYSGQPFGSAVLLWSLAMLVLEFIEARFPWRGFWQDWAIAAVAGALYLASALLVSGGVPSVYMLFALIPQILLTMLAYPVIAQIVAWLDLFRLARVKVID